MIADTSIIGYAFLRKKISEKDYWWLRHMIVLYLDTLVT